MFELTTDTLDQVIQESPKILVQYGATWCGNCRMIKPKFKKLSEEITDTQFIYVDAEKLPKSRKLAKVDHLPTFALFIDGQLKKQNQGNKIEVVKELLNEVANN